MGSALRLFLIWAFFTSGSLSVLAGRVNCPHSQQGPFRPTIADISENGPDTIAVLAGRRIWHFSRHSGQLLKEELVGGAGRKFLPTNTSGDFLLLGVRPFLYQPEIGQTKGLELPKANEVARGGHLIVLANDNAIMGIRPDGQYLGRMTFPVARIDGERVLRDPILLLAASPDGRLVASASEHGLVRIVDFEVRRVVREITLPGVSPLAIQFRGSDAVVEIIGRDGRLISVDAETARVSEVLPALDANIKHAAFVPLKQAVVLINPKGGVTFRHTESKMTLWSTVAVGGGVPTGVYPTQDGRQIFVVHSNNRMSVLAALDGVVSYTTCLFSGGEWASVLPEGFFAASRGGSRHLTLQRAGRTVPIDSAYEVLERPDLVAIRARGGDQASILTALRQIPPDAELSIAEIPRILDVRLALGTPTDSLLAFVDVVLDSPFADPTRLEWRIDGVAMAAQVAPHSPPAKGRGRHVRRFSVPVGWGEAALDVRAFGRESGAGSAPFVRKIRRGFVPEVKPPRLFVLSIGVDRYPSPDVSLKFPSTDAIAIMTRLHDLGQGIFSSVEVKMLANSEASIAQIEAALGSIASVIQPQDAFVLFVAGHGRTMEGSYFYVPGGVDPRNDAAVLRSALDQRQLQRWLARLPTARSLVIVDTCESGSLIDDATFHNRRQAQEVALGRFARSTGRLTLTATTAYGQALDGVSGHSALTASILSALEAADSNHNGLIEVSELVSFVLNDAPKRTEMAFGWRQPVRAAQTGRDFAIARSSRGSTGHR